MMWWSSIFILGLVCVINGQKDVHQSADNSSIEQSGRFSTTHTLFTTPSPALSPQHNSPETETAIDASPQILSEKNTKCVPQLKATFSPNESSEIVHKKIISVIQELLVKYLPMNMPARQVIIEELYKETVSIAQRVLHRNNKYIVSPPKVPGQLKFLDFNGNVIKKPQPWQDMVTKGRKASFAMKYSDIVYTTVISPASDKENCFCNCRLNNKWSLMMKSTKLQAKKNSNNMMMAKKQPNQVKKNKNRESNVQVDLKYSNIKNKNRSMLVSMNDKIPNYVDTNKTNMPLEKVKNKNKPPRINLKKPVTFSPLKVDAVSNIKNLSIKTEMSPKISLPLKDVDTTNKNITQEINSAIDENVTMLPLKVDTVGNNNNVSIKTNHRTKRNLSVLPLKEIINNKMPPKGNLLLNSVSTNVTVLRSEVVQNKNITSNINLTIDKNVTALPLKVDTLGNNNNVSININSSLHGNVSVLPSQEINNVQMPSKVHLSLNNVDNDVTVLRTERKLLNENITSNIDVAIDKNVTTNVTTLPLKVDTVGNNNNVSIDINNNSSHGNVSVLLYKEINNNQTPPKVNSSLDDVDLNVTVLRTKPVTNKNITSNINVVIDKNSTTNVPTLPLKVDALGNNNNVLMNTNNS